MLLLIQNRPSLPLHWDSIRKLSTGAIRQGQSALPLWATLRTPNARLRQVSIIQESIEHHSQRIEGIALDVWREGKWQQVADAKVVGYKRILLFDDVTTDKLRLRITASRICPTVSWFSLHRQPAMDSIAAKARRDAEPGRKDQGAAK